MNNNQQNSIKQSGKQIFENFLTEKFPLNCGALMQKFEKLTELYFSVNAVINISALRNEDDVYIKHYLDALYPYKHFDGECADVGCGGGFPCLPLAIATGLDFFGIESVGKKLTLIKNCISEQLVQSVTPCHIRAEDLAKQGKRFDTVCARAVADTDKVLQYCAPLAKQGGKIILYKSQSENPALAKTETKLKVKLIDTQDYTLPNTDVARRIFIYAKQ